MAEYIDRELAIQEIQSWDNNGFINKPTRKIPQILSEKNVPTADVIERSKIDKAIEELRKEIEKNRLNVIDYANGEWIVKDFVYGAIERFKRKIGE